HSADGNVSGVASFTTNHNSVVCLPLVSEGLKLVWTQSDQTRELDTIAELIQAFNLFPYPSSREVGALARVCALPLDKVKVWFMVQRIKYGISWSSEEIEETRRKLAVPELCEDSPDTNKEAEMTTNQTHRPVFQLHPPTSSGFILLPATSGNATQNYSQHTAAKQDQQVQPLPLITQKPSQLNGVKSQEVARSNGIRNSHFFQTFLSNSLEAFGDRVLEAEGYDGTEELSGDGDSLKDEEQSEELPLQLTCKIEPDVPQEPSGDLKTSPCSSPSASPPPSASPSKPLSNNTSTSKKSAHSAKASPSQTPLHVSKAPSSTSTSPALTPAGRPRKTKEQLDVLKQHFLRCQWPKSEDYTELVKLTNLPRADVIQWFGDTRYAVKNGQLRWVKGVRDQFLAELAAQQSSSGGGGLTNGSGSATSTRAGGRKRKSQATASSADLPDIQPLVAYYLGTGSLHERDLDSLCKKSRMSYQQVRDWF
uniref:Homeobox and leucine zipper encoding a n=1 Tax=Gasterosteus aculeatus TaxID=69293 RepID=G3PM95_GASAC